MEEPTDPEGNLMGSREEAFDKKVARDNARDVELEEARAARARAEATADALIAAQQRQAAPVAPPPRVDLSPAPDPVTDPNAAREWATRNARETAARLAELERTTYLDRLWSDFSAKYPDCVAANELVTAAFNEETNGTQVVAGDVSAAMARVAARVRARQKEIAASMSRPTPGRTEGVLQGQGDPPPAPRKPDAPKRKNMIEQIKDVQSKFESSSGKYF